MTAARPTGAHALRRELGPLAAGAIVVGEVVGIGIFLTPAAMVTALGSPLWLLVVWAIAGVMALSGALTIAELAARLPQTGGLYVYLREAFGPGWAFLFGWISLLVVDPGVTAALGVGVGEHLGYLVNLTAGQTKLAGMGAVLAVAAVNVVGVRTGVRVLTGLTALKLMILGAIVSWAFVSGRGSWGNVTPLIADGAGPGLSGIAAAFVLAFFAFGGWWDVSKVSGEVRDPARVLPTALGLGVILVVFVYVATSAAFLYLVPLEQVTSGQTFAAQAGEVLFGPAGGAVLASAVIVAVLGSLAAFLMAPPRVYYAMARDGLFFQAIGAVHPRFGTPARAITIQATLACILIVLGTFDQIVGYFITAAVAFIAVASAGIFVLRRRHGAPETYRTPLYPATPIVFLALSAVILALLVVGNPLRTALGATVVALGVPVYLWTLGNRSRR